MKELYLQHTVNETIRMSGIGLHSGKKVEITLLPAPVDHGIVFRRSDLAKPALIEVTATSIKPTPLCTTIYNESGDSIATIEHLMAALASVGISNIVIDVEGPEIPILDGSASPWLYLLSECGVKVQDAPRTFMRVTKEVMVQDGDKWAKLSPGNGTNIDFTIDFNHPAIEGTSQNLAVDITPKSFRELSNARTFGFMNDIEALRENGLILGGSMDNAVVMDSFKILNPEGLRHEDEFVRHKVLDAFGDLYAVGHLMLGKMTAYKSGHALNNKLLQAALETEDAVEFVTLSRAPQNELNAEELNYAALLWA